MKNIVVLDGYTLNPGDLSWGGLEQLGRLVVYDRTPAEQIVERAYEAEILITNKTPARQCGEPHWRLGRGEAR